MRLTVRRLLIAVALLAAAFRGSIRPEASHPVEATSSDPKVAVRQQKMLAGVLWGLCFEEARERSRDLDRPILIFFTGLADANSRLMEVAVLPQADIAPLLARFVTVRLDIDSVPIRSLTPAQREAVAAANLDLQVALIGEATTPCFVALDARGTVLAKQVGLRTEPAEFADFLNWALTAYRRRPGAGASPPQTGTRR